MEAYFEHGQHNGHARQGPIVDNARPYRMQRYIQPRMTLLGLMPAPDHRESELRLIMDVSLEADKSRRRSLQPASPKQQQLAAINLAAHLVQARSSFTQYSDAADYLNGATYLLLCLNAPEIPEDLCAREPLAEYR